MTDEPLPPLPEAVEKAIKDYHSATYAQARQEKQYGPPAFVPVTEYAALVLAIRRALMEEREACAKLIEDGALNGAWLSSIVRARSDRKATP